MKTYRTSIEISAAAERVWTVLTEDLQHDPTPYGILRIDGVLSLNSRISLWSEVDPKRAFALRVKTFQAPKKDGLARWHAIGFVYWNADIHAVRDRRQDHL